MAVEQKRIKDAIKKLFPKVNLSTERLAEFVPKLAAKPADDADDAAVEQVINDFNDIMPFADIAANDDRLRTYASKEKTTATGSQSNGNQSNPATGNSTADQNNLSDEDRRIAAIVSAAIKPFSEKIEQLEQGQKGLTNSQKLEKLKTDAATKNIPDFLLENIQIDENFNHDTVLNGLVTKWADIQTKHFNGATSYRAPNPAADGNGKTADIHPAVKRAQQKAAAEAAANKVKP